jgi:valyl-tRNA synthetase
MADSAASQLSPEDDVERLQEQVDLLEQEAQKINNKLNSDGFVCRAPAAKIESERQRMEKCLNLAKHYRERVAEIRSEP